MNIPIVMPAVEVVHPANRSWMQVRFAIAVETAMAGTADVAHRRGVLVWD